MRTSAVVAPEAAAMESLVDEQVARERSLGPLVYVSRDRVRLELEIAAIKRRMRGCDGLL